MTSHSRNHRLGLAAADPTGEEPAIDAVPDEVREAARRAFRARDRHTDVLALTSDTLLDEGDRSGPRRLTFGPPDSPECVVVAVEEGHGDAGVMLDIRCSSPRARLDEVQCGGQEAPIRAVGDGCWAAGPAPHGLFSASLTMGERATRTAWVRV